MVAGKADGAGLVSSRLRLAPLMFEDFSGTILKLYDCLLIRQKIIIIGL